MSGVEEWGEAQRFFRNLNLRFKTIKIRGKKKDKKSTKARKSTNMITYIIKRILIMIPLVLFSLIMTWLLSHMMAVDPILNRVGFTDPEVLELERQRVGYYDPWFVQLGRYLLNFFSGDWGESYILKPGKPVLTFIGEIFPKTFELMIIPILISPVIAVKLGATAASNKDKKKDSIIRFIAIIGAAFPVFWIAKVVQVFFGVFLNDVTNGQLEIAVMLTNTPGLSYPGPPGGFITGFRILDSIIYNDQAFLWDTILHLFLPTITMLFFSFSGITALTRSSMLEVLDQDYIRTARAKGVAEKDVIDKHALRNALLPSSDKIVGGLFGAFLGSLFVEMIFNYEGFGYWFIQSVLQGDYLVISGLTIFSTIFALSGTLIADVVYTIIDPRITYK